MKKAIYIFLIGLSLCLNSCSGRPEVVDFTVISTLVEIHKDEEPRYREMRNLEAGNMGLQQLVTKHTEENREIVEKIKKRYVNTNLILTEVGKLPQALQLIEDIKNYQVDILGIVQDKPALSAIAIETEILLLKRVNRLYNYVYLNAIVGSNFNRIPIAKRLEIIDFVIQELRIIRGYCYSIYKRMRNGKNGSTVRAILREFDIDLLYRDIDKEQIINSVMGEL